MRDEHVDDLIDLYALGALEADEQAAVDMHLDDCGRCRTRLAETKRLVQLLAWTPDQQDPPPALRNRLMRRVQQLQRTQGDQPRSWWQRILPSFGIPMPQLASGLALAMALAFVVTGARAVQLQSEVGRLQGQVQSQQVLLDILRSPDTRLVALAQDGGANAPRAQLLVDPAGASGYIVTSSLPALSPDETYQLWLIDDGRPVSAGLFRVDARGVAGVPITASLPFENYQAVGISREPDGGSDQPTDVVLLNEL